MKSQRVFICAAIVLLIQIGNVVALENNISGNARISGMGFAQVANDNGLLSNPAGFAEESFTINSSNSELFATGVIYNYYEIGFKLSSSLQLKIGYESVEDHDQFDNSGYGQKLMALGLAVRLGPAIRVGATISQSQYMLLGERTGTGYSLDVGVGYGPKRLGAAKLNWGLKIDDLSAQRKYTTSRKEIPQTQVSLGGQLSTDHLIFAADLQSDSFRCGIEYKVVPSLSLRAGLEKGQLTVGVGISRSFMRIDYAYWLAEVGPTHRISTGFSF